MSEQGPQFPGWDRVSHGVYERYDAAGARYVVARLDGWNWGWVAASRTGHVLGGKLSSSIDVFQAIAEADRAIAAAAGI